MATKKSNGNVTVTGVFNSTKVFSGMGGKIISAYLNNVLVTRSRTLPDGKKVSKEYQRTLVVQWQYDDNHVAYGDTFEFQDYVEDMITPLVRKTVSVELSKTVGYNKTNYFNVVDAVESSAKPVDITLIGESNFK